MRRYALCFFAVMAAVLGLGFIKGRAYTYSGEEIKKAAERVVASPVYGEIKKGSRLYTKACEDSGFSEADKKLRAEIIRDFSTEWYLVALEDKSRVWVRGEDINIPAEGLASEDMLTDREIECFINTGGFSSRTDRFIWVDIYRQQVYILKGRAENFTLEKRMACATGRNVSPTTRGLFETSDKGEWFYSARLKSGAKYWVRFNGSYLFHSVAMDKEGHVTDPVLGEKRSSGCVRTSLEDAEYIYNTTEKGTAVFIN